MVHIRLRKERWTKASQWRCIGVFGLTCAIANSFIMTITVWHAHFLGGNRFCVLINVYNEAVVEVVVLPIVTIAAVIGLYEYVRKM